MSGDAGPDRTSRRLHHPMVTGTGGNFNSWRSSRSCFHPIAGCRVLCARSRANQSRDIGGSMHFRTASISSALRVVSAGLLAAMLCGRGPALAQQPPPQPPASPQVVLSPGTQLLLSRVQNGQTLERYLDTLRSDFLQIDADAD